MKKKKVISVYGRFFLMAVLAFALLPGFTANEAAAAEKTFNWRCPTVYTSVMPDYQELLRMAENLKQMSGGRLVIKMFPSGALIPGKDLYDAVKAGTVEMGCGWPNWWIGKNPAWNLLNDQPFGFRRKEAFLMWYWHEGGMKFANELTGPDNMKWVPGIFTGVQTGAFCRTPIRSLAEAKGKKFRIGPGLHMAVLKKHNISTVSLAPEETYQALERGVIDMTEWLTPATDYPLKFHEVAKYILAPAWWQPTGLSDFLINRNMYNKLPKDLQAMLDTAMRDASHHGAFLLKNMDRQYMEKFVEAGCKISKWPKKDLDVLEKDTMQIMNEYAGKYPLFKKIWESQKQYRKKYYQYEEWTTF